jgi:hypothetical protein
MAGQPNETLEETIEKYVRSDITFLTSVPLKSMDADHCIKVFESARKYRQQKPLGYASDKNWRKFQFTLIADVLSYDSNQLLCHRLDVSLEYQ